MTTPPRQRRNIVPVKNERGNGWHYNLDNAAVAREVLLFVRARSPLSFKVRTRDHQLSLWSVGNDFYVREPSPEGGVVVRLEGLSDAQEYFHGKTLDTAPRPAIASDYEEILPGTNELC